MNLRTKKILISSALITGALAISVPTAITLTSCSNSKDQNPVLSLYSSYLQAKQNLIPNQYGLVDQTQKQQIINNLESYIKQFETLEQQANNKQLDLNINQTVWLDSILFDLNQELKNYQLNIDWLGSIPTDNAKVYPCDAFNNYVVNNANDALDLDTKIDTNNVSNGIKKLNDYVNFLKQLQTNFTNGMNNQVAQSIIVQRLFIANLLTNLYANELEYWAQPNNNPSDNSQYKAISIDEIINGPKTTKNNYIKTNYLMKNVQSVESSSVSNTLKEEYKNAATAAQNQLNSFMEFFVNDYFNKAIASDSTFGFGGTTRPFLYKTEPTTTSNNDKEVERTYADKSGKNKLYGMGLTTQDLTTKNVGLGFMKNSKVGSEIYQHLLDISTTTGISAQDIYTKGLANTEAGVSNMKALANAVIGLQTNNYPKQENTESNPKIVASNNWNPVIAYDSDGNGPQQPQVMQLSFTYLNDPTTNDTEYTKNWENFNKWLNNEDFFWGRERQESKLNNSATTPKPSNTGLAESADNSQQPPAAQPNGSLGNLMFTDKDYKVLLSDNIPSAEQLKAYDLTFEEWSTYKQLLIETGYWDQWNQNGKQLGNIPTQTALCGAITELRDYYKFANEYASYVNGTYTEKVAPFKIRPYNYTDKDVAGVGEEGDSTKEWIYINVDPYLDLQKWSETSFTAHETFLGHRTQMEYALEHPATVNGKKGPQFSLTAFHEGWAVFVEWFNVQIFNYGVADPNGGIPTDFGPQNATGFIPGDKHGGPLSGIVNFQNGIYWNSLVKQASTTNNVNDQNNETDWTRASMLGNMLQYYGYLNESQLRNMRQAVDTALHANVSTTKANGGLSGGDSIQDVRDYLHNNSALGFGDISSESLRYLANPAQATSYMTGKDVMQEIYEAVDAKYAKDNNLPLHSMWKDDKYIRGLFDVYLRNGEIPLATLKNEVYSVYNISQK